MEFTPRLLFALGFGFIVYAACSTSPAFGYAAMSAIFIFLFAKI